MSKIKVENPVVELDGDEMTRIIWQLIKRSSSIPISTSIFEYFDLSIEHRDATNDQGDARRGGRHQGTAASASNARPSRPTKRGSRNSV